MRPHISAVQLSLALRIALLPCIALPALPQFFSFPKFPEAEHHHLKIPWTYPEADHYLSALQDSMMPRIFGTQYVHVHELHSPALPAQLTRWLLCLTRCTLSSAVSQA